MNYDFHYWLQNFELRELRSERDIVDHLALRRKVYQKEYSNEYTDSGYDLLPSDWKASLIGIFSGNQQIASIRVVKRYVNADIENQLHRINKNFRLNVTPDNSGILPTEYAFTISSFNNPGYKDGTIELSRVAVVDEFRGLGLCRYAMLAAIGIAILDNAKYCLYSCANTSVGYHADLVPMMEGVVAAQNRDGYPGFTFPRSSAAVLSEIQSMSRQHMNQAILAGIVCRFGMGVLGEGFLERTPQIVETV